MSEGMLRSLGKCFFREEMVQGRRKSKWKKEVNSDNGGRRKKEEIKEKKTKKKEKKKREREKRKDKEMGAKFPPSPTLFQ